LGAIVVDWRRWRQARLVSQVTAIELRGVEPGRIGEQRRGAVLAGEPSTT